MNRIEVLIAFLAATFLLACSPAPPTDGEEAGYSGAIRAAAVAEPTPEGPSTRADDPSPGAVRDLLKPADGSGPSRATLESISADARAELIALLDDTDPQVRTNAAVSLGGWLPDEEVRTLLLLRALDTTLTAGDRAAAIMALGESPNDVGRDLAPLLSEAEPPEVQVQVVRTLARVPALRADVRAFVQSEGVHPAARRLGERYLQGP